MTVNNERTNFMVQNLFWATENEQAGRYVQLALRCLDTSRSLYFPFEQSPVVKSDGGTVGPKPSWVNQMQCSDLDFYKQRIQDENNNATFMSLMPSLNHFGSEFTRMFYEKVPCEGNAEENVRDILTNDEISFINPHLQLSEDSTIEPDDFFMVAVKGKFHVQNTFWAKSGFEEIAKKVARYICTLEKSRSLFFPFKQDPVFNNEGGTVGEMPTFVFISDFETLDEYKNKIICEQNDPNFMNALKILSTCVDKFTRQFATEPAHE